MLIADAVIRRLLPADAEAYRSLRLAGLAESPEAFGSDVATESASGLDHFAATLRDGYVASAYAGERLVALAGLHHSTREKMLHRATIWGVYVAPEARGVGLGRRVVTHVIDHARTQVMQVHLSVTTTNTAAVALYESLGFVIYGTEPRALYVNGRYLDEYLMVLRFS